MSDIIELPHDYQIDTGPSIKEIYQAKLGKDVSKDKFLFACLEEERTIRAIFKGDLDPKHSLYSSHGIEEDQPFLEDLKSLFSWHIEKFPYLGEETAIDYENLQKVAFQFVHLVDDLATLAFDKLGYEELPIRGAEPSPAQAKESAEEVSKVEATPEPTEAKSETAEVSPEDTKSNGASETTEPEAVQSEVPEAEFWNIIDTAAKESFHGRAAKLSDLLDWTFQQMENVEYDLKTLPPIGRFAEILKRQLRRSKRDHQNKMRRQASTGRRPRGQKSNQEAQEVGEKDAIEACEKLRQDASLDGILLKPQNSFIRRLQHKKIAALGFASSSVGEAAERAVKVMREPLE